MTTSANITNDTKLIKVKIIKYFYISILKQSLSYLNTSYSGIGISFDN